MDISPEAPIEFEIPPNLVDNDGNLIVDLTNGSQIPLSLHWRMGWKPFTDKVALLGISSGGCW